MDPEDVIISGNEYVIAQLTLPTGTSTTVTVNVQGKTFLEGQDANHWAQEQIQFQITPPETVEPNIIPQNCISWYDGCNTCRVNNGVIGACTRMMCFQEEEPYCISSSSGH